MDREYAARRRGHGAGWLDVRNVRRRELRGSDDRFCQLRRLRQCLSARRAMRGWAMLVHRRAHKLQWRLRRYPDRSSALRIMRQCMHGRSILQCRRLRNVLRTAHALRRSMRRSEYGSAQLRRLWNGLLRGRSLLRWKMRLSRRWCILQWQVRGYPNRFQQLRSLRQRLRSWTNLHGRQMRLWQCERLLRNGRAAHLHGILRDRWLS